VIQLMQFENAHLQVKLQLNTSVKEFYGGFDMTKRSPPHSPLSSWVIYMFLLAGNVSITRCSQQEPSLLF